MNAIGCSAAMRGVQLNAREPSPKTLCGNQRGAGATERIEHDFAGRSERTDQGFQNGDGFLRGMDAISRVGPVDHVGNRIGR